MPNYRELEQRLYNYTDGWTKYDGAFPVETKKDKENAEAILKNHYSDVDPNHLDYDNKHVEGTDYRIEFDEALEGEDERFDRIYNSISKSIEDEDRAVEETYKKEKKKHKSDELQFMPEFNPTLINASQQATVTNPGGAMSESLIEEYNGGINISVFIANTLDEALPSGDIEDVYDEQTLEDWYDFVATVEGIIERDCKIVNISQSKHEDSLSEYIDFYKNADKESCLIDLRVSNHKESEGGRSLRKKKARRIDPHFQLVSVIVNNKRFDTYEQALDYVNELVYGSIVNESYDLPDLETFREYCSNKFTDLGTVEYYNYSGYPDEAKVLMVVDIGDYDDVQIISDEYGALIGVKDKEIVFDTDTTDPATFALSMDFKEIDNDFYDELIENMGDMLVESLDEAVEKHSELNPDLWDDTELKPEVKEKLIEIAEKFKDNLAQDNIELDIIDEVIVGSNANYNYNATSDIDLHIVADTSVYKDCRELAAKLYEAYKRLWNNKYDPTIYGHEVEIYVEPDGLKVNSNGIYSLTTGWIKAPKHEIIPDIDQSELDARVETWADKISEAETLEEIDGIIDELYIMRQQGILANGEFDLDNLTFKEIRSRGILQELRDKKVDLETGEMSLTESYSNFSDFIKNAEVILVDDASTFDINKWELETDSELEEDLDTAIEHENRFMKYKLSSDDIKAIVDKLKVSDISIADYWKTKQFLKSNNLDKSDLEEVIRSIEPNDYVINSKSIDNNYNEACIFIKTSKIKDLGPFKLYIKIDYDSIANTPVIVISIHKTK